MKLNPYLIIAAIALLFFAGSFGVFCAVTYHLDHNVAPVCRPACVQPVCIVV